MRRLCGDLFGSNGRKASDSQPDYRVSAGGAEVGGGWLRRSETLGKADRGAIHPVRARSEKGLRDIIVAVEEGRAGLTGKALAQPV